MVRNFLKDGYEVQGIETGCLEVVVNRKTNTLMKALHYGAIVVAVCFCLSAFLIHFALLLPAAGCMVAAYLFWLEITVDYEYVYVDKEIRVAKIQQKERRKDLAVYDLTKMEVMAPSGSYHLDEYRNKNLTVFDYSSGEEDNKPFRYEVVMEGGSKLILDFVGEYGEQIITILRTYFPRKVFTN